MFKELIRAAAGPPVSRQAQADVGSQTRAEEAAAQAPVTVVEALVVHTAVCSRRRVRLDAARQDPEMEHPSVHALERGQPREAKLVTHR